MGTDKHCSKVWNQGYHQWQLQEFCLHQQFEFEDRHYIPSNLRGGHGSGCNISSGVGWHRSSDIRMRPRRSCATFSNNMTAPLVVSTDFLLALQGNVSKLLATITLHLAHFTRQRLSRRFAFGIKSNSVVLYSVLLQMSLCQQEFFTKMHIRTII